MATRAKFRCDDSRKQYDSTLVTLHAVYGDSPDNAAFFEATPSGTVQMNIKNDVASALFTPGKEYYVDFTPAE